MCSHTKNLFKLGYRTFLSAQDSETNNNKCLSHHHHLNLYKKRIEKIFQLIKNFYSIKSNVNEKRECFCCHTQVHLSSRSHICLLCLYIGCFNFSDSGNTHSRQHFALTDHAIAIDMTYGAVYCFKCGDYQYDEKIEQIIGDFLRSEKIFLAGAFFEWSPSIEMIKILKSFELNNTLALTKPSSDKIGLTTFRVKGHSSFFGLRGLINFGNTCFMNCILQTFTHTPSLRDYFLSDQHICISSIEKSTSNQKSSFTNNNNNNNNREVCLVCEIVELFQEFYSGKRTPYMPYNFLHQVWLQVKHLAGYEQQDAHEFFIAALNSIHKNCIDNDLNCLNLNKSNLSFINYNNCYCIIDKIFTGGLQSDVICSFCSHVSTKVDPFWDISLDLYKNTCKNNEGGDPSDKLHSTAKSKINDKTKLEDCIHNFTQAEVLTSFSCSNCKLTKEAKKQLTMKNLPIVCCFHLKRFQKSNKIHKKISEHISFPVILDMTPYMSTTAEHARSQINADMYETIRTTKTTDSTASSDNSSPPPPPPPSPPPLSNENTYFLFAVVNHHGTLETGHYTSFVRHNTHEWFKCDDHIISKASVNDVMQSEGYLLFYHKMWNNFQSNDYLT